MDGRTAWTADSRAAVEAIAASVAVLAGLSGAGAVRSETPGLDSPRDAVFPAARRVPAGRLSAAAPGG
ncbi:hypothetical protein [Arthrobacter sp. MMS18-M83]|uniref:hypothetical protein n=1 Tax=Arthrobacter sp. MMS18-M83 TaxID=2996261 RepID=UPI00227C2E1D|nr:hypothetical protein [Arthrobacter sp. MMS18-M83]WAH97092.1 hypothetical protein OW521_22510 [Arthrobacter sp. MMS18-M83]